MENAGLTLGYDEYIIGTKAKNTSRRLIAGKFKVILGLTFLTMKQACF
jgi:hypothetical protein